MIIKILCILLIFVSCASSADIYNTSYTYYDQDYTYFAGENVITPHYHFNDKYFSLYNDGKVTYQIYMRDYIGQVTNVVNGSTYKNSFIGVIEPDQMIMLTNNASYYIYADYKDITDLMDIEKVEKKFNQWWIIILVGIILLIGAIRVIKVIR